VESHVTKVPGGPFSREGYRKTRGFSFVKDKKEGNAAHLSVEKSKTRIYDTGRNLVRKEKNIDIYDQPAEGSTRTIYSKKTIREPKVKKDRKKKKK